MQRPDSPAQRMAPPPCPITRTVIALCCAVMLMQSLLPPASAAGVLHEAGLIPARLTLSLTYGRWSTQFAALATVLSAVFLHGGWMHLASNMVMLWFCGRPLEWIYGTGRFALLLLGSAGAAGAVHIAADPQSIVPMVGASGAISGLFAAYILLFARSRPAARRVLGVMISSNVAQIISLVLFWLVLQAMMALAFADGESGIAIWAHIGGFFAGLALCRPLLPRRR